MNFYTKSFTARENYKKHDHQTNFSFRTNHHHLSSLLSLSPKNQQVISSFETGMAPL